MRLRRRASAEPAIPDGPPVRRFDCDRECVTRWDQEPRHTEACDRRWREAAERVDAMQRESMEQMRRYLDYRSKRLP